MADRPSPDVVKGALRLMADALHDQYPALEFFPVKRGEDVSDDVRTIPIVRDEPVDDRGELRPRDGRVDPDAGE